MIAVSARNLLKYFMILTAENLRALNHIEFRNIYLNTFSPLKLVYFQN